MDAPGTDPHAGRAALGRPRTPLPQDGGRTDDIPGCMFGGPCDRHPETTGRNTPGRTADGHPVGRFADIAPGGRTLVCGRATGGPGACGRVCGRAHDGICVERRAISAAAAAADALVPSGFPDNGA